MLFVARMPFKINEFPVGKSNFSLCKCKATVKKECPLQWDFQGTGA